MSNMNRPYWLIILALLGIALVANPLYLYPDGGGHYEATYEVERINDKETATTALQASEQVLHCPGERPCALEEEILDAGSVEYDLDHQEGDQRWYRVIWMDGDTYAPSETYDDETIVFTLEEVERMEAVERVAVPATERSEEVREAVETGSVTVYGEQVEDFEQHMIIEHDGEYYHRARYEVRGGHWTANWALPSVRMALFALGGGLLVYSGLWHPREV